MMLFPRVLKMEAPNYGDAKKVADPEVSIRVAIPLDHPELPRLKQVLGAVRDAKFGKDAKGIVLPIAVGDTMADKGKARNERKGKKVSPVEEAMRGHIILTAKSKQFLPNLSYFDGKNIIEVAEDIRQQSGGKFYSGCLGTVEVKFSAYDGNGSNIANGVTCYLQAVCSLNKGDK